MQIADSFAPHSAAEWHNWLQKNHETASFVWLVYYKVNSGIPTLTYVEAVEEALCFGWIDSKAQAIDDRCYKQYFCKRKPDSVWSRVNKEKVERLMEAGLVQPAGLKTIEIAKANGMWNILDSAEALIIPKDLKQALKQNKGSAAFFEKLSRTDKRNLLQWLALAKLTETRAKRVLNIATLAAAGQKPKGF